MFYGLIVDQIDDWQYKTVRTNYSWLTKVLQDLWPFTFSWFLILKYDLSLCLAYITLNYFTKLSFLNIIWIS